MRLSTRILAWRVSFRLYQWKKDDLRNGSLELDRQIFGIQLERETKCSLREAVLAHQTLGFIFRSSAILRSWVRKPHRFAASDTQTACL